MCCLAAHTHLLVPPCPRCREVLDLLGSADQAMLRLFFRPEEWDAAAAASKAARLAALGGTSEADAPEAAPGTPGFDVDAILAAASSALAGLEAPPAAAGGAHAKGADGGAGGAASSAGGGGGGGAKMMAVTVGAQFKTQLNELLTVVRATTPHYVRCLKPNAAQVPRQLERDSVVGQLRCGGVLEAVRVSLTMGEGKVSGSIPPPSLSSACSRWRASATPCARRTPSSCATMASSARAPPLLQPAPWPRRATQRAPRRASSRTSSRRYR